MYLNVLKKMEELSTKRKLGEYIISVAFNKLNSWATNEITNLNYKIKSPICVPLTKNSWLVGNYKIVYTNKKRYSIITDDQVVHSFKNKQAAFFYALLDKCRKYDLSREIMHSDDLCSRLEEEKQIFERNLVKYRKQKNFFKEQLLEARLSEVNLKLKQANQDLEKNLNSAKYVKVWE